MDAIPSLEDLEVEQAQHDQQDAQQAFSDAFNALNIAVAKHSLEGELLENVRHHMAELLSQFDQRHRAKQASKAMEHARTLEQAFGHDLFTTPPPERQALLRHPGEQGAMFLPSNKVGLLVAAGGSGKTAMLVQLAASIATGIRWLGYFEIERPGKVLLLLGEEDLEEIHRRLHGVAASFALTDEAWRWMSTCPFLDREVIHATPEEKDRVLATYRRHLLKRVHVVPLMGQRVPLIEQDAHGNYLNTDFAEQLAKYIEDHSSEDDPFRTIIMDPGSRFMGLDDENDNAGATRFIEACEELTKLPGKPTILVAHHTNKASMNTVASQASSRGASAFVDGARWVAQLQKLDVPETEELASVYSAAMLSLVKSNYGPTMNERLVTFGPKGWRMADKDTQQTITNAIYFERALERERNKAIENEVKQQVQAEQNTEQTIPKISTSSGDVLGDIPK